MANETLFIRSVDDSRAGTRDHQGMPSLPGENAPLALSTLSRRERDVFDAALEGLSARDIAERLSLTEATVRSHLSAVYSKLGVAGRVELLARVGGKARPTNDVVAKQSNRGVGQPGRDLRKSAALVVVFTMVLVAATVLILQLSTPRLIDLATVSRLMASNAVERLDLSGSTLTVTEKGSGQLRVEAVTADEFRSIETAAIDSSIPVTVSSGVQTPLSTQAAILATLSIPVLLLLGVLFVLSRRFKRPPPVRFAD